ncbi:hypothetical protein EIP86_005911 [Pleurotus ostreatoroseus]|nr:hypothetical protein EIP86_005911 [Pleurotus ostreatoroseus]
MSKFNPSRDLLDLHGKVAIVTGGNSGIGFWTVSHLSRKGAKVYMAARNEQKAKNALERLAEVAKDCKDVGEVVWLPLDLDDPREVQRAAEVFMSKERRLDILINNAGMLAGPFEKTKDGVSRMMVVKYVILIQPFAVVFNEYTSHISPFVFTNTLYPVLEKTSREEGSDVRVINLKHTDFTSLEGFNETYASEYFADMKVYAKSKLANILWTKSLQQRYDFDDIAITCISLHPGGVYSEGVLGTYKHLPLGLGWVATKTTKWVLLGAEEGAYTSLFAAASKTVSEKRQEYRATYLVPFGKITTPSSLARDAELGQALWKTTDQILQDNYQM